VQALAISPNERFVALAKTHGVTTALSVLDWRTRSELAYEELQNAQVAALSFSPDNARLYSITKRGEVVVRTFGGANPKPFAVRGCASAAVSAEVSAKGILSVLCEDGALRLFDSNLQVRQEVALAVEAGPHSVRFSPDGSKLAVGYRSARVDVFNSESLQTVYSPAIPSTGTGDLRFVAWSDDGSNVYAAGTRQGEGTYRLYRWAEGGRGRLTDMRTGTAPIAALSTFRTHPESVLVRSQVPTTSYRFLGAAVELPKDCVAVATESPNLSVLLEGGERAPFPTRAVSEFPTGELLVDVTGTQIQFRVGSDSATRSSFSLSSRSLRSGAGTDSRLHAPRAQVNVSMVAQGMAAVEVDGGRVVSSTASKLVLTNQLGVQIWTTSLPAAAAALNFSGDGRLVVCALTDGTIRWHSANSGRELLALWVHPDHRRWILWTPSGYYDESGGTESLLGWHRNRDRSQSADFFPVGSMRSQYYRPDVISRVLYTLDQTRALEEANAEAGRRNTELPLESLLPPVVTIVTPEDGLSVNTSAVSIRVRLQAPSGQPIQSWRALVVGRSRQARRAVVQETAAPAANPLLAPGEHVISVQIPPEDCSIVVIAENAYAKSEPATVRLRWSGPIQKASQARSNLHVLAVGVGKYQTQTYGLSYPPKDSKDFIEALQAQRNHLYEEVESRILTDAKATRGAILDGLRWLSRVSTPDDVTMILLAGHGINDTTAGRYYFLPYEAELHDLSSTALSSEELQEALRDISGRLVLFLDTCNAGSVLGESTSDSRPYLKRFANELAAVASGVVVYAASTGEQLSQESSLWRNGAFSKAAIEGLRGKADLSQNGRVTVNSLDHYISERVRDLTRGTQTPTTAKPRTVEDFLLTQVGLPIQKRWWFWTLLGVGVVGTVGAVLGATKPWEPTLPSVTF